MEANAFSGMAPYSGIQDIDDVRSILTKADNETIESIIGIISENGLHKELGICLLHKHFELSENEILVEAEIDDKLISMAIPAGSSKRKITPMVWRVFNDQTPPIPLHWRIEEEDELGQVKQFFCSPILNRIKLLLAKNIDRFGIIRKSLMEKRVSKGEILLEKTYINQKMLICSKISREGNSGISTAWYASSKKLASSDRYCDQYSRRYCDAEVIRTCDERHGEHGYYGHDRHEKTKHNKEVQNFHDRVSR